MTERVCLIVDDEPAIRAYVRAILERTNVQILEASNAVQALEILNKLGNGIDLMITDVQMPGDMDGVDLAHSVRNSHPALPVMLISGCANKAAAGGFPFVQKPFLPEAILETIGELLAPEKTQGAASH